MRSPKIWYWLIVMLVLILAAAITTLFPQTNEVPVSEDTKTLDTSNKVEPKQAVPTSNSPDENIDPSDMVALQQLFNDLRKEYLDTQAGVINWWLQFITIVLAFFGIVVVVLGYFGLQEFKKLKAKAEKDANEINDLLFEVMKSCEAFERAREKAESGEFGVESDEAIHHMRETLSSEIFATLSNDEEFENSLRDFEQIHNLSFVDKAMVKAYKLQKDSRIEEAIRKWRSIANIVDETDKNLAARAWYSVGYLLSELEQTEDAISAFDKAVEMKADYADVYYNRGRQKVELYQYLDAIEDFDKAIDLDFPEAKVYIFRGIAKFELDEHDNAFTDFDRAIYLKPDFAYAHTIRGGAKAELNDIGGAKVDFQTALGLAKQHGEKELIDQIEKKLQALNESE